MDNNQYLLGLMTTRCRMLEVTVEKLAEANKALAAELTALKEKKAPATKVIDLEKKRLEKKNKPDGKK